MMEQAFNDVEAMLDLGADADLGLFQLFVDAAQLGILERLAQSRSHGGVPFDRCRCVFRPFANVLVAGITEHDLLATAQQGVRLRDVGDVACRAHDRVHQAGGQVDTNVG